ncbi:FAD-dependent oxidoreductase [Georgenia wangjunii]|uniref:FAD-dependent oxidoreductase n=1 Tax=Georgenia wangjunii TaxID=3117730 RepID=UPI002F269DBD
MSSSRPLSVAIIGAGPAGIYAADILTKAGLDVRIDLLERLPAPFGLVRYGVAPDHPRIKQIIVALQRILGRGDIQLIGNVEVGSDITLEELRDRYDAVIVATGADRDAPLPVPGADLPGSYGAADFVSWYDGHPDAARTWPLEAQHVAVLGVGNVALDVARILAKGVDDLLVTEIPANVAEGLRASAVTDVHVFGRRGPAQVKFTPLELRELGHVPGVDVIVYPEDFEFDEGSMEAIRSSNQTKQVVKTLTDWTLREPEELTAPRRIHLHFLHRPVEILGTDRVTGVRTERTELAGDGSVRGTGEFVDTPVGAVYRAVGYFGSPVPGLPFDATGGVVPNEEGRVIDEQGEVVTGVYATGWIKRGPVGLIGSTKSDAQQTIGHLVEDAQAGRLAARSAGEGERAVGHDALIAHLEAADVAYTTWAGWELLDAYERSLGETEGRERIKVVPREDMIRVSREETS